MNIITTCVQVLKITRPFNITIKSAENKKVDAWYIPIYSPKKHNLTHEIVIYFGNNTRPIESCIAHEFVHAWQEENGITEYHGPKFKYQAQKLEYITGLSGIFRAETDINEP